jgi:two-component system NtrC family sensor kinase
MSAKKNKKIGLVVPARPLTWPEQVELLNEMSRMAKVGGWEFDPATGQGSWTDEVARIHDLDPGQPGNMQFSLDCYTGESRTRMEQALRDVVEQGKPYDLELAFRSAKGILKWVRTTGRPVLEGGRVVKVWGTLQDITERKQAEQKLRLSEEKFSKIFDSSPESIMLTELDTGRFVEVNESFEKLSGYTRAEVLGRSSVEIGLVTAAERQRFADLLRQQGHIREGEFCQHYKAGRQGQVLLSAELLLIDGRQHILSSFHDITARQQMEQALQEEQLLLRTLMDHLPDHIYFKDAASRFIRVNQAMARLFGVSDPAQLIGKSDADFFSAEHAQQAWADEQAIMQQGRPLLHSEEKETWPDGHESWVSTSKVPLRDLAGNIMGTCGISSDITERKRIEAALRESEEHYRLLADNAEDFVFLNDVEGHRRYVSPSYYRMTGWTPEESESADWSARLHPDDLPLIERTRVANLAGQPTSIEHRIRCRDGAWLWVETRCKPVLDCAGQVEHLLLWACDITRRRQAEEKSLRLATAVEQAAECIVITDPAGSIQYANPAFERITGYACAEVLGQNPRVLKSGSHDAAFYQQMWATLHRGEVWSGHFINRRKDGALYEEEGTISPVRNPAGVVTHYVAIKRDVTAEMNLQRQLTQAQKMETVGQLAGGVAHDFNNILQTILGYCELLLKNTPASDERHHDLVEIQRSGERAAELTRQLLAFSRKQMLMPRVHDLNDLIVNLTKMLTRLIGEEIQLKLELGGSLQQVKVDAGQMDQMLINLAINARDAMPQGGLLCLRTANVHLDEDDLPLHPDGRAGSFVCLSITDNGSGMTRDIQAHIFEPFFTTKGQGKGTGLGLSTVYGLIKQHDGWITVYSEPGQGTTFRVYLPAVDAATAAPHVAVPAVAPPGEGHGERVLIVEDDALVRRMTQQMLNRHGYRAMAVGSCTEAQATYNGLIDLVLSDVILPDGNGLDLARQFQQRRPGLRCILTSGYADIHERWPEIEQHHWPFLIKPYSQAELLRAIATALARA